MVIEITKTQIDRLGDRLRDGHIVEADLRMLDEYRRSFSGTYDKVLTQIGDQLGLSPTGRSAKSTTSVVEKLRRETIRLTQMQDIGGCRLVVTDIAEQDRIVASLKDLFPQSTVTDRREVPSYGYRAVHVIVRCDDKCIEIQVRTSLQHRWAEISEKLSDMLGPEIKYGGGIEKIRDPLSRLSSAIAEVESFEKHSIELVSIARDVPEEETRKDVAALRQVIESRKTSIARTLEEIFSALNEE